MITYPGVHISIALTPSGQFLACSYKDKPIEVIDLETGQSRWTKAFTRDGSSIHFPSPSTIVYVSRKNVLCSYDLNRELGRELLKLNVDALAVATKEDIVAIAQDKQILVVSLDGTLLHELKGCRASVSNIKFLNNANTLVATGDKQVLRWNLDQAKPKAEPLVTGLIKKGVSLAVSSDDRLLFVATEQTYNDYPFVVYDLSSGEPLADYKSLDVWGENYPVFCGDTYLLCKKSHEGLVLVNMDGEFRPTGVDGLVRDIVSGDAAAAVLGYGLTRIINLSKRDLFQPPLINQKRIHTMLTYNNRLYTFSAADVVVRELDGTPLSRVMHTNNLGPFMVVRTSQEDLVWLVGSYDMAYLFDLVELKFVNKTQEGLKPACSGACRPADNRTLFLSRAHEGKTRTSPGSIAVYSDDAQCIYRRDDLLVPRVLTSWVHEGDVYILGEVSRVIYTVESRKYSKVAPNVDKILSAFASPETGRIYVAVEAGDSNFIQSLNIDLSNETDPHWLVPSGGLIIKDWLNPGVSLLVQDDSGELLSLECGNGELRPLGINEWKAECALMVSKTRLALGLTNGTVRTFERPDSCL